MIPYIERVFEQTKQRNPNEPEFLQTVEEVLTSLEPLLEKHPEYEQYSILERIVEPERVIEFRVAWLDDNNKVQVNRGYRVQFNGALGPYKGGLRFHPTVNRSILKFLGFEQIFKNALTTLPIGGGKGGSDFDPKGKSDTEIMRFTQAYMSELYRHIGPNTDVPAGDIGVGAREIGYLYGQYRRLRNAYENGVLTGKPALMGGSILRPEATGYGALYFTQEIFQHENDNIQGKTFALSGYGNVAWGAAKKIAELGGKAVTISGHNGFVYDPDGITTKEKLDYLLEIRSSKHPNVKMYAERFHCEFFEGQKPWTIKADVYMPCATQNEVDLEDAKQIVEHNAKYYIEVSNMPTTKDALAYIQANNVIVAPAKAANAGGVAVSALEMSQNSMRYAWSEEEVDEKLKAIMKEIYNAAEQAATTYNLGYNLVQGANLAGFEKVANAMIQQGVF